MKKLLIVILLAAILLALCAGCNEPMAEEVRTFDRAQIRMPDGTVVSGTVEAWRVLAYKDTMQVRIDGVIYLTHSANVVLWTE